MEPSQRNKYHKPSLHSIRFTSCPFINLSHFLLKAISIQSVAVTYLTLEMKKCLPDSVNESVAVFCCSDDRPTRGYFSILSLCNRSPCRQISQQQVMLIRQTRIICIQLDLLVLFLLACIHFFLTSKRAESFFTFQKLEYKDIM